MNATATQIRKPSDVATWGTWKDHGNAQVLGYMGRDRSSAGMAVRVVKVAMERGQLVMRSTKDNEIVNQFGPAGRFWAVTAPAQVPQPRQAEKVTAAKATRPSRNAKLAPCHCGCKAQVKGLYKQGHDARHAGDVARKAIAAGADADLTEILAELPTEALRVKAAKVVASRVK